MLSLILGMIVGVVEVSPGLCRVYYLNSGQTITTSLVACETVSPTYEPLP